MLLVPQTAAAAWRVLLACVSVYLALFFFVVLRFCLLFPLGLTLTLFICGGINSSVLSANSR